MTFADHLELGMCFDDRFDDQGDFDYSGEPQVVDCGSPHDNEVVLVSSLDGGADAPYPDDEVWDDYFDDVCDPAVRGFLGIDGEPSALDAYFLAPDAEEWAAGSRSAPCVVYLPDARLAGSVEGAGDEIVPAGFPADAPPHWSGGVATAEYALEKDETRMIAEIWELEGGDSRLHFFYAPVIRG